MRVIVDSVGQYVGVAYVNVPLVNGQRVVDISPADLDNLLAGGRIGSIQDVLDQNRAFRDSPQLDNLLAIDPATIAGAADPRTAFWAAVPPDALLRLLQLMIRTERSDKRQLNTLIRKATFGTDPGMVVPGDDDFGPGL